ncbi:kinase-like domain-containing protein [Aspergillus egyptiacus]|nr:kinase-like domain-containing protein [Aspergillus egyptiacus]
MTALQRLEDRLRDSRVASTERPHVFVPDSILKRLVAENVSDVLTELGVLDAERIPCFAQLISQRAARLFAALVNVREGSSIVPLLEEGIRDDDLPFVKDSSSRESQPSLLTKQGQRVQALKAWTNQSINSFETKQYRVLSPVFRRGEHYELDDLHVLPFVNKDMDANPRRVAKGGYGEVSQACIHPDHHEFGDSPAKEHLGVAVKRMYHDDSFEPERNVYRDLGPSTHPHLIDLLFTFRKGGHYHFVFRRANGSLKDYWDQHPHQSVTPALLIWSMEQMVGIASGLAFFHEFTNPEIDVPRFGRHGDIKAQNILRFPASNGPGTLKLADLGLARVHRMHSKSDVDPTTVIVSPTYSPPDVGRNCRVSRKWDIWGLGCLYLEFITYLVLGAEAITEFSEKRLQDGSSAEAVFRIDNFYSTDHKSVKPSVLDWVDRLKQNSRCSRMMHDVLDIVIKQMIVIQPEALSSALGICQALKEVLCRAKEEDGYLQAQNVDGDSTTSPGVRPVEFPPIPPPLSRESSTPGRRGTWG